ncbi:MAG: YdjY domain-containing protein, partial [Planctomycetota bacterium]
VVPVLAKRWAELQAKYEQDKQKDALLAIPPSEDALPKPAPKLLWQQGQDKWHVDASPAITGDFVLVASAFLDDEKCGKRSLFCLKAADGSIVWEAPLNLNPWAGPTVAGQMVLVGCSNIRFDKKLIEKAQGEVVAVDLASGQVRWRQDMAGGVLSSIAVKGDVAVCTSTGGKVAALNCATGQPLWTYQAKQPFFGGAAIAGETVYVADLKAVVHALNLGNGTVEWTFDLGGDPSVQVRSEAFSSPTVHGGDLYLATCNVDGEADQPCYIVCLSDKRSALQTAAVPIIIDAERRRVSIPCRIAPRKLSWLKDIYPLEVIATYPTPRGQKAHETVLIFDSKPSDVHKALESFGLKPGKPVQGEGVLAAGPEVKISIEVPGPTGKPRLVAIEKVMVDTRTGLALSGMTWRFTGSVLRQPDPDKEERVYAADLSGTLISLLPVTDETVCQAELELRNGKLLHLETNRDLLPPEGTEVKLVIEAK